MKDSLKESAQTNHLSFKHQQKDLFYAITMHSNCKLTFNSGILFYFNTAEDLAVQETHNIKKKELF